MSNRAFFTIMAIVGTIVPWYFFGGFIIENGAYITDFIAAAFANDAAAGGIVDLVLSSVIFWVWSYYDAREKGIKGWWVLVPLNVLVGLSLALPLYIVMRMNKMRPATQV